MLYEIEHVCYNILEHVYNSMFPCIQYNVCILKIYTYTHTLTYTHIYIYICVCVLKNICSELNVSKLIYEVSIFTIHSTPIVCQQYTIVHKTITYDNYYDCPQYTTSVVSLRAADTKRYTPMFYRGHALVDVLRNSYVSIASSLVC